MTKFVMIFFIVASGISIYTTYDGITQDTIVDNYKENIRSNSKSNRRYNSSGYNYGK